MLDNIKQAATSTKNFTKKHRVAIAVTTTAVLCTVVHVRVIAQHNEFLKEHDLFDTFYAMSELDEI